ncbi:Hypothetical predicted protein [Mytilus galloprovincialis]|uniref:Uncharacterized protein n=1 Tax=Mytilus galloprovincialis TaxID=29158 RepID=A0A8B6BY42_MYTGA|nr:Hypothetical predicted protein [Mytilus galloprovincialis]
MCLIFLEKYFGKLKSKKSLKQQQYMYDREMLFTAIEMDNYKLATIIITAGTLPVTCINISGATPLTAVCQETLCLNTKGKLKFVKLLLKRKTSLEMRDIYGKTAHDYIIENGFADIQQLYEAHLKSACQRKDSK